MAASGFALFDTPIGRCGIAWTERGVACVQLPEASDAKMRARLQRESRGAPESPPPASVQCAIDAIGALLRGDRIDLGGIALDMERVPPFDRRVYEVARAIPPGMTRSYGEIAAELGDPIQPDDLRSPSARCASADSRVGLLARDVGRALARNPFSIVVPCHRVLAANGALGGFSAHGGVEAKLRLLAIEGARTTDQLGLFDRAAAPLVSCRTD